MLSTKLLNDSCRKPKLALHSKPWFAVLMSQFVHTPLSKFWFAVNISISDSLCSASRGLLFLIKGALAPLVPKGTSFVIINATGLNFPVLDTCTTQINARLTGIKKALCCAQSLSINIVPSRNSLCTASRSLLFLIKGALAPLVPRDFIRHHQR